MFLWTVDFYNSKKLQKQTTSVSGHKSIHNFEATKTLWFIAYFLNECTDEEFYWLAEAFEEISEKAQRKDLIVTWRSRLATVTLENYNQRKKSYCSSTKQ